MYSLIRKKSKLALFCKYKQSSFIFSIRWTVKFNFNKTVWCLQATLTDIRVTIWIWNEFEDMEGIAFDMEPFEIAAILKTINHCWPFIFFPVRCGLTALFGSSWVGYIRCGKVSKHFLLRWVGQCVRMALYNRTSLIPSWESNLGSAHGLAPFHSTTHLTISTQFHFLYLPFTYAGVNHRCKQLFTNFIFKNLVLELMEIKKSLLFFNEQRYWKY